MEVIKVRIIGNVPCECGKIHPDPEYMYYDEDGDEVLIWCSDLNKWVRPAWYGNIKFKEIKYD
jgi:hypothetical protein